MKSEELDEALKGIGEPEGRRGLCWSSVSGMMANAYVDFESTMQVVIWDRGWDGFKDWLEKIGPGAVGVQNTGSSVFDE